MAAKALLVGLGNPVLGDDAIGLVLARAVVARLAASPLPAACATLDALDVEDDCSAGGLELLAVLEGRPRVVLLDAIVTGCAPPGTLHRLTAAALPPTRHLAGPHDADLATALALGRRLGLDLPPDEAIAIFAVEIEPCREFRATLTPALERALPVLAEAVMDDLLADLAALSSPRAAR